MSVFEADFVPLENGSLTDSERAVAVSLLDAYPRNGTVSIVEWKRFCRMVAQSKLTIIDFIRAWAQTNGAGSA